MTGSIPVAAAIEIIKSRADGALSSMAWSKEKFGFRPATPEEAIQGLRDQLLRDMRNLQERSAS